MASPLVYTRYCSNDRELVGRFESRQRQGTLVSSIASRAACGLSSLIFSGAGGSFTRFEAI